MRDRDEAIIAVDYAYIIEGKQICWKCHQATRVIGLGIGEFYHLYYDDDENAVKLEFSEDAGGISEVHLAWANSPDEIPEKILSYIQSHYTVKTGFSRTLGHNCYANFCEHCGALQGNHYLFDEESVLQPYSEGEELKRDIQQLRVFEIPLEDDFIVDWNIGYGSNDYAYLKYAHKEELDLFG